MEAAAVANDSMIESVLAEALPPWSADDIAALETPEAVAHLDQYFGPWAIMPDVLQEGAAMLARLNLQTHLQQQANAATADGGYKYQVTDDGVAVIRLMGPLTKYYSSLTGGTATSLIRRDIRNATRDDRVKSIMLMIDSPGGTVAGTADLATEVAKAAAQKTVVAYIEDLGASAAYWVASQAHKVYANSTALVGSIGTYAVVWDASGAAAREGIKVHVIRAGEMKGAGEPGTEVTPAQLAEFQRIVDEMNEFFVRGVAGGRKMTLQATRELADGRVWIGADAEKRRLVDGVRSYEEVIAELTGSTVRSARTRSAATGDGRKESVAMAEANQVASEPQPVETATKAGSPATFDELVAELAGADAAFIVDCQQKKLAITQARTAWMSEQNARIVAANEKASQARHKPGLPAITDEVGATGFVGNPIAEFDRRVREQMGSGTDRRAAAIRVARADSALHEAYLLARNPRPRQQALIKERFAMA